MGRTKRSTTGEETGDNAQMLSLAPFGAVLGVKDIDQASQFYQKTLGFEQQFALPRADGQLTLAVLRAGTSALLLGRIDELHYEHEERARKIRRGPRGLGITFTLVVPDVEKVYRAIKKAGCVILLEPVDEFYGDRIFMFVDPDGYEWKISQTIREVGPEQIAEIVAQS